MENVIENLEGEIWKDVVGYEGLYHVSNLGRVKSIRKIRKYRYTNEKYIKETLLSNNVFTQGYPCGSLYKNLEKTRYLFHRLLAQAFIPNPENKPCVNHIDGNPKNCTLENLEWVTYSENHLHAYRTGLKVGSKKRKGIKILQPYNYKEIVQLTPNGELVRVIPHRNYLISEGFFHTGITNSYKNKTKTGLYKGFKWMLKKDYDKINHT